ncbi:hypothetical protein D3C75_764460 [compost metagenome]
MPLQISGHCHGRFAVLLHTQGKCSCAAHNKPCVEGADGSAQIDHSLSFDGVNPFLATDNGAAHGVSVAVYVFGEAVNHQICPKRKRLLEIGGGKGAVHGQQGASFMGNSGNRLNVAHPCGGITRRFNVHQPGVGPHGLPHRLRVRRVHQRSLNAVLGGIIFIQQPVHRNVRYIGADHMGPRLQKGKEHAGQRRYTRCQHHTSLAALQIGQLFLQVALVG